MNDRWFGAFWLCVFSWLLYTLREKRFETAAFPGALLIILIILCLILIFRKGHNEKYDFRHLRAVLLYGGLTVAYALLLPHIGFILSTTAFLSIFLICLKYPLKPWWIVLISAVVAFLLWLLFAKGFSVRLPEILF